MKLRNPLLSSPSSPTYRLPPLYPGRREDPSSEFVLSSACNTSTQPILFVIIPLALYIPCLDPLPRPRPKPAGQFSQSLRYSRFHFHSAHCLVIFYLYSSLSRSLYSSLPFFLSSNLVIISLPISHIFATHIYSHLIIYTSHLHPYKIPTT